MLALEFFKWWYSSGWTGVLKATKRRLGSLLNMFSISILLRTLFAPWRRIITYPGAGMEAHMRALGDNLVSRVVGFVVRITVLICAGVLLLVFLVIALVQIVLWPLLPAASVGLLVWGLVP